jgi:hypothetical protein
VVAKSPNHFDKHDMRIPIQIENDYACRSPWDVAYCMLCSMITYHMKNLGTIR